MGLFTPAWKTADEKKIGKAIKEISRIDDVNDLIIVIKDANLDDIRQAAVQKLLEDTDSFDYRDQVKVLNTAEDDGIRNVIFEKLLNDTDQSDSEKVSYVIRCMKNERLSSRFFDSINDENTLLDIYLDSCGRYQVSAFMRIKDQGILKNIFRNMRGCRWEDTAEMIGDDEFFKKILSEFKGNDERRICAVRGIRDQKIIEEIAFNEENIAVRRAAISKIEDIGVMGMIVEDAYKRAVDAAGPGCIPEEDICRFEFDCKDKLYCRKYGSERLKYVNYQDGKDLAYTEQSMYGEYSVFADFNNGITVKWGGKVKDYRLGYPNSKVVLTDEPLCGDEIFICPECYGVREGEVRILDRCTCGSKMSAPRVHYEDLYED